MHILSDHNRSEFLATPQLVRFDYAVAQDTHEPSLLIKTSSLMLKYILQNVEMTLIMARLQDHLLYAVKIFDDPLHPAVIWSIAERESEKKALTALAAEHECKVYLFNELALNVAWTQRKIHITSNLEQLISQAKIETIEDYTEFQDMASEIFSQLENKDDIYVESLNVDISNKWPWNPVINHYITNSITNIPVDFFNKDEGSQQEQLAIWLTDNLHPSGVYHSPQIPKGNGYRELTDVFLSYENGSFLVESKTLTIFNRTSLPDREKLMSDVSSHVKKAISQLKGGIRQLKAGTVVTDKNGKTINVEREKPAHAIVLIPELHLIKDPTSYGYELMTDFMKSTGGFIHLLDITELLRIVQAAEMISERSANISLMMAFDYYLLERFKKCQKSGTLCIEVLLRFLEDNV